MPDLEQKLIELGAAISWPATPRLRVVPGRRLNLLRWALAAAAALLIVAGLLAYTPTRDAIAGFLNLHTTIHRVPAVVTASPQPGQALGLGTPTTLAQAQNRLSWHVNVPEGLGQPDHVYLALPPDGPSGGEVTLVYTSVSGIPLSPQTGVSVLVTEARGTVDEQFFVKTVGEGTTVESVDVNGHHGWWISGRPHSIAFVDANGNPYFDTLRLAANTLIIDDGGTVVRIEGNMSKAQALQLAAGI